jgi:hypothetical protein
MDIISKLMNNTPGINTTLLRSNGMAAGCGLDGERRWGENCDCRD